MSVPRSYSPQKGFCFEMTPAPIKLPVPTGPRVVFATSINTCAKFLCSQFIFVEMALKKRKFGPECNLLLVRLWEEYVSKTSTLECALIWWKLKNPQRERSERLCNKSETITGDWHCRRWKLWQRSCRRVVSSGVDWHSRRSCVRRRLSFPTEVRRRNVPRSTPVDQPRPTSAAPAVHQSAFIDTHVNSLTGTQYPQQKIFTEHYDGWYTMSVSGLVVSVLWCWAEWAKCIKCIELPING